MAAGNSNAVSFQSTNYPAMYITIVGKTDGASEDTRLVCVPLQARAKIFDGRWLRLLMGRLRYPDNPDDAPPLPIHCRASQPQATTTTPPSC